MKLTLTHISTRRSYTFTDLEDTSTNKTHYRVELDLAKLGDGEYTYLLDSGEMGMLRIGEPRETLVYIDTVNVYYSPSEIPYYSYGDADKDEIIEPGLYYGVLSKPRVPQTLRLPYTGMEEAVYEVSFWRDGIRLNPKEVTLHVRNNTHWVQAEYSDGRVKLRVLPNNDEPERDTLLYFTVDGDVFTWMTIIEEMKEQSQPDEDERLVWTGAQKIYFIPAEGITLQIPYRGRLEYVREGDVTMFENIDDGGDVLTIRFGSNIGAFDERTAWLKAKDGTCVYFAQSNYPYDDFRWNPQVIYAPMSGGKYQVGFTSGRYPDATSYDVSWQTKEISDLEMQPDRKLAFSVGYASWERIGWIQPANDVAGNTDIPGGTGYRPRCYVIQCWELPEGLEYTKEHNHSDEPVNPPVTPPDEPVEPPTGEPEEQVFAIYANNDSNNLSENANVKVGEISGETGSVSVYMLNEMADDNFELRMCLAYPASYRLTGVEVWNKVLQEFRTYRDDAWVEDDGKATMEGYKQWRRVDDYPIAGGQFRFTFTRIEQDEPAEPTEPEGNTLGKPDANGRYSVYVNWVSGEKGLRENADCDYHYAIYEPGGFGSSITQPTAYPYMYIVRGGIYLERTMGALAYPDFYEIDKVEIENEHPNEGGKYYTEIVPEHYIVDDGESVIAGYKQLRFVDKYETIDDIHMPVGFRNLYYSFRITFREKA